MSKPISPNISDYAYFIHDIEHAIQLEFIDGQSELQILRFTDLVLKENYRPIKNIYYTYEIFDALMQKEYYDAETAQKCIDQFESDEPFLEYSTVNKVLQELNAKAMDFNAYLREHFIYCDICKSWYPQHR